MMREKTKLRGPAWRMVLVVVWLGGWTALTAWARQEEQQAMPDPAVITGHVGDVIRVGAGTSPESAGEHWKLVSRPAGSRAVLSPNREGSGLRLQPDVDGIYVIGDEEASGAVDSETRIEVGPAGTSTPVETRVVSVTGSQSEDYSIVVNGKSYPAQAGLPPDGLMILALERETLAVKARGTFGDLVEARNFLRNLLDQKGLDALYIISSLQKVGGPVSIITPELLRLGANYEFAGITDPNFSFTFIGSKGWHPGEAYQAGYPAQGGLGGYFVRDALKNYTFLQTDYARFSLRPSTNGPASVQIGNGPAIQSALMTGLGGFLLAVFDRASLEVKGSDTYYTLANSYDTTSEIQRLVNTLQSYQGNEQVLLALVSFGQAARGFDPLFGTEARAVSNLGGTYEAVYNLNSGDTYALLVSGNPPEALGLPRFPIAEAGSQVSPQAASGALGGILGRGRRGTWYAPVASTTAAAANLELYSILAQTPVPFPHPAPGHAGEQRAYDYISSRLCIGDDPANCSDLRANYGNSNFDLRTRLSILLRLKDQDHPTIDCDFTSVQTDFCTVRNQLRNELVYATDIRNFNTNLTSLWTDYQSNVGPTLTAAQEFLKKQIRLDEARRAQPVIPPAVSTFFTIASYVPGNIGAVAGVVNGALLFTSYVTNRADGSSPVFDVETKAGDLAKVATEAFVQQLQANGVMFRFLYEDWRKLEALGQALQSGQRGWYWDDTIKAGLLKQLSSAFEISSYRSLISTLLVRRIWNVQSGDYNEPGWYKYYVKTRSYSIFRDWKNTPDGYLATRSPRTDNGRAQLDFFVLTQPGKFEPRNIFNPFTYEKVPGAILQKVFGPGGIGVYKQEFYRQWPLPTLYCGAPFQNYSISHCDYTTPQLRQ